MGPSPDEHIVCEQTPAASSSAAGDATAMWSLHRAVSSERAAPEPVLRPCGADGAEGRIGEDFP